MREEKKEPSYRFILVNDQTGETVCNLESRYVEDMSNPRLPTQESLDNAIYEALSKVGYAVKVATI